MYLRISNRIINTDNLVDAMIYEEGDTLSPHRAEYAEMRTVVLHTIGTCRDREGALAPRTIRLEGGDAERFLAALPVYTPVIEEE